MGLLKIFSRNFLRFFFSPPPGLPKRRCVCAAVNAAFLVAPLSSFLARSFVLPSPFLIQQQKQILRSVPLVYKDASSYDFLLALTSALCQF